MLSMRSCPLTITHRRASLSFSCQKVGCPCGGDRCLVRLIPLHQSHNPVPVFHSVFCIHCPDAILSHLSGEIDFQFCSDCIWSVIAPQTALSATCLLQAAVALPLEIPPPLSLLHCEWFYSMYLSSDWHDFLS